MSDTLASSRLKTLAWIDHPGFRANERSAFTSVEALERTLSSSISGLGPNQRTRRLPDQRSRSCTARPAAKTPSMAPGMRSPAGSSSVKRALE